MTPLPGTCAHCKKRIWWHQKGQVWADLKSWRGLSARTIAHFPCETA